jgi:hypothetical protein
MAKHSSKFITKRSIQIILGLFWLLDGALQFQRQMFSSNFANKVIAPAATGQPIVIAGPMHLFVHLILLHPAIFNTFFATVQVLLGLLILNKKTIKIGLVASLFWSLGVWSLGEGLGGLLGLHTIILMGAPGAALLYAVLSVGVYPYKSDDKKEENRPAFWLPFAWFFLWLLGAIYQLLPGQNTASSISSMLATNAQGAPGWMYSLDIHAANIISGLTNNSSVSSMHMTALQMSQMQTQSTNGSWFIVVLVIIQLLVACFILFPGICRKAAISIGILLSLIFWVVGQSLGTYFTGRATDPNSGPLFILLGIAILGCYPLTFKELINKSLNELENLIT